MRDRKVVDVFLVNDEIDLMEMRIKYLSPVVDQFVGIEHLHTFSGIEKTSLISEADRVEALTFKYRFDIFTFEEDMPVGYAGYSIGSRDDNMQRFARESWQRNSMEHALNLFFDVDGIASGDLILMSDVDEIPSIEAVRYLKENPKECAFCPQQFRYYLNVVNQHEPWQRCTVAAIWPLKMGPQEYRNSRYDMPVLNAGWHFSTINVDLNKKLREFAHAEFDTLEYHAMVSSRKAALEDPFGRYAEKYLVIPPENIGLPMNIVREYGFWIKEKE